MVELQCLGGAVRPFPSVVCLLHLAADFANLQAEQLAPAWGPAWYLANLVEEQQHLFAAFVVDGVSDSVDAAAGYWTMTTSAD